MFKKILFTFLSFDKAEKEVLLRFRFHFQQIFTPLYDN